MMTVSGVPRTPRANWPAMPQAPDYDVISPDFPPPSRKPQDGARELEKQRKKKWSIGGLFRRKKRVSDSDSSSALEDEEEKKGFLERRRSARKKRNRGSKDVTGSFEHVRLNHSAQPMEVDPADRRELREVTNERLLGKSQDEPLWKRQQDSQTCGSSLSLENAGRKGGRIQVKARVEASRDKLGADSSSDEGASSRNSTTSALRLRGEDSTGSKDGSLSRRSRAARTERYKKRLSRDDESLRDFNVGPASRISRSDERLSNKNKILDKAPANNRWTAKVVYYESSDYETKYTAKTKSATPSPLQSPKTRPKNPLHYTASAPPSSNYVTYPPSHAREGVVGSHQELRSHHFPSSGTQISNRTNQRFIDTTPPRLPKSNSEMINKIPHFVPNQKHYPSWNQDLVNRKSASYDCNVNYLHQGAQISQPHPMDENVLVVQFPISKPGQRMQNAIPNTSVSPPQYPLKLQNPPPPPPRDPNRKVLLPNSYHESNTRPMSYAFEDRSPEPLKKLIYPEFGSSTSAFQRVPQNTTASSNNMPKINTNNRSSSDQQITSHINAIKMSPNMPRRPSSAQQSPSTRNIFTSVESFASSPPSDISNMPFHYQYYTDQQPRSRKPIHIPYSEQNSHNEPHFSEPHVVEKPPVQQSPRTRPTGVQSATEFWKQKDQENSQKIHITEGSPKLIQRHLMNVNSSNDRAVTSNKYIDGSTKPKVKLAPLVMPGKGLEYSGSVSSHSSPRDFPSPRTHNCVPPVHNEIGIPVFENGDSLNARREFRPMSMLEEKTEMSERDISTLKDVPPNPLRSPGGKDFQINSSRNNEIHAKLNDTSREKEKKSSNNLEEALNELEAIYNSLQTSEDAHTEKIAKERSLYENNRLDPTNWNAWVQSRGFESDSSYNYSRSSLESVDSIDSPIKRKSKVKKFAASPDRVTDDMAYRKLNKKEKAPPQEQEVISQVGSFLLVSPTLSPPPFKETFKEINPFPPVKNEPDITLDDVVYRSIKHVNNTLKVLDPQPPFGIPLGPVAPAPNSDYLHVTPKEVYRPTFRPRKTPDVVSDDLAFRNLRKDNNKEPLFCPEDTTLINIPALKKKRAVRSLSANLLSIMQKEPVAFKNNNNLIYNNNCLQNDLEKSQSFTDLIKNLNMNGTGSKYFNDNFREANELRTKRDFTGYDSDATPRASRQFLTGNSSPSGATSTETLTEAKSYTVHQNEKTGNYNNSRNSSPKLRLTPERRLTADSINPFKRNTDSPIKHVPIKLEPFKISFLDQPKPKLPEPQINVTSNSHIVLDNNNEEERSSSALDKPDSDYLSKLAREAAEASEQLSKELNDLKYDESINPLSFQSSENRVIKKVENSDLNIVKEVTSSTSQSKPLLIGKITPHKPVKLNTFKITDDNKLENKQTEVTNEPIEIECSKSMTDLLKELTKSLDIDFDSSKDTEDQSSSAREETEDEKSAPLLQGENTDDQDETTEPEMFSEAVEPRDRKELEENYFSSFEEIQDRNISSPEQQTLLLTLNELEPSASDGRLETTSPTKNSFPLVIPDDEDSEELKQSATDVQAPQQRRDQSNNTSLVSRRENNPGVSRDPGSSRDSTDSRTPGCSSSRDPDCSMDCSNMTDEGTKSQIVSVNSLLDSGTVVLACMACVHQIAGLDFLTILGLILAIASLVLFLVL